MYFVVSNPLLGGPVLDGSIPTQDVPGVFSRQDQPQRMKESTNHEPRSVDSLIRWPPNTTDHPFAASGSSPTRTSKWLHMTAKPRSIRVYRGFRLEARLAQNGPKLKEFIRESFSPSLRSLATGSARRNQPLGRCSNHLSWNVIECPRRASENARFRQTGLSKPLRSPTPNGCGPLPRTGGHPRHFFLPRRMIAVGRSGFQADRRIPEIHGKPGWTKTADTRGEARPGSPAGEDGLARVGPGGYHRMLGRSLTGRVAVGRIYGSREASADRGCEKMGLAPSGKQRKP